LVIKIRAIVFVFISLSIGFGAPVYASPGTLALSRSPVLVESPGIRPRVNFWIDVFTRYGKHSSVFHHRDYPHVTFGVLDFTREAKEMSPHRLEIHKKAQKERHNDIIRAAFSRLASGQSPTSSLEKSIAGQMRTIPGGLGKYRKVLDENLIRNQTGIKEKFEEAIIRSGRYMPTMERIFAEHGLPVELTRLPFIESSFDYKAYSSVGAAGIWQFMPGTARAFKLKLTSAIDERRDPVEATKAAARYLIQAYNELGTWPLALTSYNHGIYGVKKAVRTMGTKDIESIVEHNGKRVFGFASNNFYAEFLAAIEVYENYQKYFPGIKIEQPLEFEEVPLANAFSINHIAKQLNTSKSSILPLNYALSKSAIDSRVLLPRGYSLKVPKGLAHKAGKLKLADLGMGAPENTASSLYGGATHRVRQNETIHDVAKRYKTTDEEIVKLNKLEKPEVRQGQYLVVKKKSSYKPKSGSYYYVRSGDNLGKIAAKHKVTLSSLMDYNGLKNHKIKIGQRIRIPEHAESTNTYKKNSNPGSSENTPNLREGKVYKVRRGDNLWKISKRYGVSIDKIKKANQLGSSELRAGDSLIIP